jgi:hypothetical protein
LRKIDVFFYGLFMDESLLRSKGVSPVNIRPASLAGYQLRIGDRATLVTSQGGIVYGLAASLSHDELERLYSEPSLQAYKPEAVLVQLSDGDAFPALCFNLPEPLSEDERNAEYISKLRELAERLNFPEEYVQSIQ